VTRSRLSEGLEEASFAANQGPPNMAIYSDREIRKSRQKVINIRDLGLAAPARVPQCQRRPPGPLPWLDEFDELRGRTWAGVVSNAHLWGITADHKSPAAGKPL